MLDQRQALYQLSHVFDWEGIERDFEGLYAERGRPAKPIRLMVGLLLLKHIEDLSDERVCEAWRRDPYMQYFCGEEFFRWEQPCNPSERVHFRHRIGEKGMERILASTVELHREEIGKVDEIVVDTTGQEADITFPTNRKLQVQIVERLWKYKERRECGGKVLIAGLRRSCWSFCAVGPIGWRSRGERLREL